MRLRASRTGPRLSAILLAAGLVPLAVPAFAAKPKDGLPKTAGWIEARTEHFTLVSNAGDKRTRKIAVQLERFRQALGRITRGFELGSDVPTRTYVFKNEASYEPYKRNRDGSTMNVSGYFQPGLFRNAIALDASAGSQPLRVVYHEFFHAVMNATLGSLPVWLNEGLAEYFSTFRDREGSSIVEVGHPIDDHLRYLAYQGLLPWGEFFRTTRNSPTYNEGTRQGSFYAQAWLLTHYLNATDERSGRLGGYLGRLRTGEDEDEAFVAAFGQDKAAIGAAVERYSKSGSGHVWWDFGEEHGEVAVALRELAPAELLFRLGELLAQRGQLEAAREHLNAARSLGWDPNAVQAAIGAATLYSGNEPAAEDELRRAIEAGAASAEPHALLGELLMRRFFTTPESDRYNATTPAPVAEARRRFERALELHPGHFETLLALARTYVFGGEDPTPGVRAVALARSQRPLDAYMLQVQASLLARAGHVRQACEVIERDLRARDADAADDAAQMVAQAVTLETMQRLAAEDRDGAAAILVEALEHLPDARLTDPLRQLHEVVVSGGRIRLLDGDEQEAAASSEDRAFERFNEAMRLANAGKHAEAVDGLEQVAAACVDEELCAEARRLAAELRGLIERNEYVERYNDAVRRANAGDRKGAVQVLRGLEAALDDPQKLAEVQELLRSLGARVAKKSKR